METVKRRKTGRFLKDWLAAARAGVAGRWLVVD
jgi:hypothetical protein